MPSATRIIRQDLVQDVPVNTLYQALMPRLLQKPSSGTINVQRYVKPGSAQENRPRGGAITSELEDAQPLDYATKEIIKRKKLDERSFANYPTQDAAYLAVARAAQIAVHTDFEKKVSAVFGAVDPFDKVDNLSMTLKKGIYTLRRRMNRRVVMFGSLAAVSAALDDQSVINAIQNPARTNILISKSGDGKENADFNFDLQIQNFAGSVGANQILIGGEEWKADELYLMIANTDGFTALDEPQFGASVIQEIESPDFMRVTEDWDVSCNSNVIDAVMNACPLVCVPEFALRITIPIA